MAFAQRSLGRKNVKGLGLALNAPPQPQASSSAQPNGNRRNQAETLEIGLEFRLDLHNEDLIVLEELGAGNGGTVTKVQHAATKAIMARKVGAFLSCLYLLVAKDV